MDRETARQLRALFDAHDEVFRALRAANREMGAVSTAMGAAIQAHDDAIQAALSANRAALDLLSHVEGGGPAEGPP